MAFSRRWDYYKRCQNIIDDIHRRVSQGEFLSERDCIKNYGPSDYWALKHELRLMNADINSSTMTPAMEWLYYSQYFLNKAADEKKQRFLFYIAGFSALFAGVSAIAAVAAVYVALIK